MRIKGWSIISIFLIGLLNMAVAQAGDVKFRAILAGTASDTGVDTNNDGEPVLLVHLLTKGKLTKRGYGWSRYTLPALGEIRSLSEFKEVGDPDECDAEFDEQLELITPTKGVWTFKDRQLSQLVLEPTQGIACVDSETDRSEVVVKGNIVGGAGRFDGVDEGEFTLEADAMGAEFNIVRGEIYGEIDD